jgi:tape measure domain-containing protein
MQFDNQGFEKGVNSTMKSLQNLNESLKMKNATNGLSDVQNGINKLTSLGMGALSQGVDSVTTKFNAMGIIAATALMNITNSAINIGKKVANALTIEPITTGFSEYETKMNAIQTILTNTASKGTTMEDVTAVLNELNTYADKTIYNFAEMTKNIGTFTAAGVDLQTSATAIKGIANLAAGSGSSAQQASTAMYQLSQALAAGRVSLMDWNSVVNAGMGGELFQNALKDTAKSMGIYVDASKPFRETLQDGWLSTDVLIKTLEKFAEDESLVKAATEVKTFTQLIDTMKESVQSGWAVSWEHIIGDKEEAAALFTSISDGFNNLIQPSTDARNAMLEYWNAYGGRTAVINGITNILNQLRQILKPIGDAWKEAFPAMTGEKLTVLSAKFEMFTKKLNVNYKTISQIKTIFKGLFEGFKLVKDGIVGLIKGMSPMKEVFSGFGDSILNVASKIGEFILKIREFANSNNVFDVMATGTKNAFENIAKFILNLKENVGIMMSYLANLDFKSFFSVIAKGFQNVGGILSPVFKGIGKVIESINFDTLFGLIKAGSAIEMVKQLKGMFEEISDTGEAAKTFLDKVVKSFTSFSDLGKSISEVLSTVKDTLMAYQKDLSASTLIKIAGAIGILAVSLLLISSINPNSLMAGLGGLGVIFAELTAAYVAMSKVGAITGIWKLGTFLVTFSIAVAVLSASLKSLSSIDSDKLANGIVGLTVVVGLAALSLKTLSKNSKNTTKAATGLIIFAAAIHVMSSALEKLGSIDSAVIGAGLTAMAVLLGEIALFLVGTKYGSLSIKSAVGLLILTGALTILVDCVKNLGEMDPDGIILGLSSIAIILSEIALFSHIISGSKMIAVGVGVLIMAAAINNLSSALKSLGGMQWDEIGRGLTVLTGSLAALALASIFMSGLKLAVLGVGITVVSASLLLLSTALKSMGSMSWEEIGKGLIVLAGSLTLLAIAMNAMMFGLPGAIAMVVMAGALAILTPQLLMLSSMNLAGVGIALLAMGGAFTVLGLAGLLLTPLVPTLLALSGIIVLLGVGASACGAGLMLAGTGLGLLGAAVAGSGLLIVEFLKSLINLIPKLGTKLAEGFVNFGVTLASNAPIIVESIKTLIMTLLEAIRTIIPELFIVATEIVIAFADAVKVAVPYLVEAGLQLVLGILEGIANNIQQIVEAGADIIINFCNGLANKLPDVIQAAFDLAITFIEGLATAIDENHEKINRAIEHLIKAMVTAFVDFVTNNFPKFKAKAKEMWDKFIEGCKEKLGEMKEAAKELIEKVKEAAIEKVDMLVDVGKDLIRGFIDGIKSMATGVIDSVTGVVQGSIDWAKSLLGINSPSRVFKEIGQYVGEGFVVGIDSYSNKVGDSAGELAESVIRNVKDPLSNIYKLLDDNIDVNPTIRPVMDLSNIENGTRLLNDMLGDQQVRLNASSVRLAGTVGKIQNGTNNKDIVDALKDLKEGLSNNGPSYTINGITYDDGSNVVNAVETLVRAARIERRI